MWSDFAKNLQITAQLCQDHQHRSDISLGQRERSASETFGCFSIAQCQLCARREVQRSAFIQSLAFICTGLDRRQGRVGTPQCGSRLAALQCKLPSQQIQYPPKMLTGRGTVA